jgi:hypothetical protein
MGQVKIELTAFLALTIEGCEWLASPSGRFTGGNEVSGDLLTDWIGPSGGMGIVAKR